MASKLCRCLQLWLMLSLSWLVLRSDPLTQESESPSENMSTEKVNLVFTEQEATPPLVSIHHTETVIPEHLDQNTLVARPAVAPATPWDDTQITLSTISSIDEKYDSTEHGILTEDQIPDVETPSSIEYLEDLHSSKDDDGQEGAQVDDSGSVAEEVIKKATESLNPVETNERQHSELGASLDHVDGTVETVESKKEQISEGERIENEIPETGEFKIPEDESLTSKNQQPDDPAPSSEIPDESTNDDSQTTEVDEDLAGTQDGLEGTQEDMPSFNEWSQKFLAQEEEKKVQQINEKGSSDTSTQPKKKSIDRKQNNYASVDCGANIPEKNPEAQNAHSILLENKDLYMLNPCSANIWFIVELCDHVQVTSLQLANFEMFSSTIEKFQVSFSTRYPTREWSQLQTFIAKPEKSIQTFTIDPIFAKYIKVEQLSHHGSEHYCPWSLLRVYGNSMVEEYEEHESSQDENTSVDEEDSTSSNTTEDEHVSQGILKSATDAVLNFVKETAKKLVNTEEQTNLTANTTNATKYPDNSTQPPPPKTIVQLMPREEFEASCHGDSDEVFTTCLSGSECGSTEHTPYSYQAFLERVYKICISKLIKSPEACFSNISVGNATDHKQKQSGNVNERILHPVLNEQDESARKQDVEKDGSRTEGENGYFTENAGVSDATVSESIEKLNTPALHDGITSSEIVASEETPSSNSVYTETSIDSRITSTILPSISSGNSLTSSCIQTDTVPSSAATSSDMCDFDCASPPTPLAQPPLAVNEEPNLAQQPTGQPGIPSKKTISEYEQANADNPKSLSGEENLDSNTADEIISKITPTSSSAYEAVTTLSSITESMIPAPEDSSAEAVDGNTFGHQGYKESFSDNKKHEEIPNPHVDVLKITLTDAETKEGTAEPEQANEETTVKSDLGSEKNGTLVDPAEGESGKPDTAPRNDTEKDIDNVETREADRPNESESGKINISVEEKSESTEISRDTDVSNESQNQPELMDNIHENSDTNLVNKDSVSSEEQCEIRDAADSKSSGESSSSNLDPGPTIHGEAVPAHVTGNGHTYGKKESIFVTLSRKIKALEQNVTMTNLFLEELSQRYRKSMEEVQRKMEKKFTILSRNSKLLTKVNLSQNSTILALTAKVEQLEKKLNEATSRLKVVNQEVVERHVLGMCLQFLFVFVLWFLLRRSGGRCEQVVRHTCVGNGHLNSGSLLCNGTDYRQQHGTFDDMEQEKNSLDEFNASKPLSLEAMTDTKRRRRRKNRPNSVVFDHALDDPPHSGQNIVSRTAGLLFHTPGSDDNIRLATKDSGALRSCSADSLTTLAEGEQNVNTKKSPLSPKSKKILSRSKKEVDGQKTRSFAFEPRLTKEPYQSPRTKLVRSKSSGECYENKLALSDIALSTPNPDRSLRNARCSLQSTGDPLKDRKSRWIWGLG